jgi:hypothetical protein
MIGEHPMSTLYDDCSICAHLAAEESAMQKYGWEKDNTYLPSEANTLTVVKDFKQHSSRKLQLKQCPQCNTYYLYRTDYEFLVNGSEDEEYLTRLSEDEAAEYLKR